MPYFAETETLGELKQEFRRLALENHPDRGGDAAIMRDIICECKGLARIPPDIEREPEKGNKAGNAENTPAVEAPRFHCPYKPTTAGGANPHLVRLASPNYSHKDICAMAKTLFVYARQKEYCDIQTFYRKLCRLIDPGQWLPYRDYHFNREIAAQSLKFMRTRVLNRIFLAWLWELFKVSLDNMRKAA